ncbi:hypothetical protein PTTG_25796 [Puccinia triticina 1-1 BBBD Race 1]|uniref:Uncharacterized protein n=2 Tax=Puccinia triticina TaxID=208348 RepID=A0A180GZ22_PUCT1|nr:hypothetical protein PTTG_25796 [Puccinia triticina 1-1 BBBD Race 1]
MEKKNISSDTLTGLDYLLKLRIPVCLLTLATGLAVFALGFKANHILGNDRKRVSDTASGIKLDSKALLNLTRTSLILSASLVINTLFLAVLLALRWHHPNPAKNDHFLQKIRPIIKLILEGQFFVVCAVFSFMVTLLSNANTKFEPMPKNLPEFRLARGIPDRYIENHYVVALVGTAWVFTSGYLIGFILEGWTLVRYKRFKKLIFIEN